ncbi:hypothetical protein FACS189490_06910 [Clostridia bacterium]|nr:hypothetical protein FACS189490_06910 [Clostridia bacterium]
MSILYIVLSIIVAVLCVAINALILMQNKRASGFGAAISGMSETTTYWDKNKGRSLEGRLERYTKIGAAAFIVISLALNFIV